ncbi:MAG: H/ACA RNA-protein complex protein Gar1 [Candidatus Heimdallarchaeota archaeon]|nr:H/ACA RNA-protein complex protein Gar1 [Candidatus Heimdallarchaeota archaeon]
MDQSRIKKLGRILHRSDLGHAILKDPPKLPKIGSDVVTESMEHIGIVNDIFGPVKQPYVSVKVKKEWDEKLTSDMVLYVIEKRRSDVRRKQRKSYPQKQNRPRE